MDINTLPSLELLHSMLSYDPPTGVLLWKKHRLRRFVGEPAGQISEGGIRIKMAQQRYYAHRIAFAMSYGEDPSYLIDHVNGDFLDNRLANLRQATPSQNQANRGATVKSASGIKGVEFHHPTGKWRARIAVQGTRYRLGSFDNKQEAKRAYDSAATGYFGNYARV